MNPKIMIIAVLQIMKFVAIIPFTVACYYSPTSIPEPTLSKPTPTPFIRQPIPLEPRVSGIFSGLLNSDDLVTIHISDENGHEVIHGTHPGNGAWEMVVTNLVASKYYVVNVEADGYASQPISYTISLDTQGNQITETVSDLNFSFHPNNP